MDLLSCPLCQAVLFEPVTVSCGHSFCKRCVGTGLPSKCHICKERLKLRDVKHVRNNVVLFSIIEKCYPEETKLKCHLQDLLKNCEFTAALRIADEGLELAPNDVSLRMSRAEANMGLQCFTDVLEDLDVLCKTRPTWTEGYFRKGNVFVEMGQKSEALIQYHHCLRLQLECAPAKQQIQKILNTDGVPIPEDIEDLLKVVSIHMRNSSPATSSMNTVSESTHLAQLLEVESKQNPCEINQAKKADCCISLCQAVSFLPGREAADDQMMKNEGATVTTESCDQTQNSPLSILSVSEFECPLCIRLFFVPVTTPCGHTFCKNCIERSLDHNLRCPLCKQQLHEYLKSRKYNHTFLIESIMTRLFPLQLAERKQVHEAEIAELSNLTKNIPIFVCTVAYPGVPCPLHIFEPRYRLMMRRCMEIGTKKFGMCTYEHGKGFADYGCILEILGLDLLPDGRSYVDTVGGSRFRVLKRGQRDGYHTADIEYIEDQKVEGAELELVQCMHDSIYQQAHDWYHRLNDRIQDQISKQYGPMPNREDDIQASPNGPSWCWWLLSVLQLDPAYQTTVLSLTSLKDRLGHIRIVLEYFSQS
ncbi:LON peptidase N-terminal domain and RING finger protein 1 [Amia ocellicauda]|uniref:LON peptidase N-terminal domain and RING finger protein 1 n=1 Tax=Amia ocellicauda TaxID=2972642 RepID=UPI0034641785|nr:LONF1 protein [Amia calva]